jgi:hypothetical protein
MKRIIFFIKTIFISAMFFSCNDYLDVVPDNVATLDYAFKNRIGAEKFLFTCYSYLYSPGDPLGSIAILGGRECWTLNDINSEGWNIARGYQTANSPLANYWDKNGFVAIRDCNIFLEEIDKVKEMGTGEKNRWKAEVKFLKAYYHYYLLQMYGPIPIIDVNIPISASPEEVQKYREPVDEVAKYIVSLLDEAMKDLPMTILLPTIELGRITQPVARALKAKTLVLVASPIFNGNPYYANIKDNREIYLFPQTYDKGKWETAAQAVKEAIDCAHQVGNSLFYFKSDDLAYLNDSTIAKLNIRGALTDREDRTRWNEELVWGSIHGEAATMDIDCAVRTSSNELTKGPNGYIAATMDVAERFYTKNGVPIDEDKTWDYGSRYQLTTAGADHRYYIKEGMETVKLHLNREARFYASLNFDGGMVYMKNKNGASIASDNPKTSVYLQMKYGEFAGRYLTSPTFLEYSVTGYTPKKVVSYYSLYSSSTGYVPYGYVFPYIRMADLYLLYAEALNEVKPAPDAEVYQWIDEVRKRASLKGVAESWTNYSMHPEKVTTQTGMREIIRRERLNELAFEGQAYWDILRWKEAETLWNRPVRGWDINGSRVNNYYVVTNIAQSRFSPKDYLFPISRKSLEQNPNLVQNYGW